MGPALIAEGLALLASLRVPGPLGLQAMIAAEHASAPSFAATRWPRIVGLHDALLTIEPSPTVAVGRCVAISYAAGPAAGLADLDEVLTLGELDTYPYAHAARAQMLDRLGRGAEAAESWVAAGRSARTDAERAFFAAASGDRHGVDDDVVAVAADVGVERSAARDQHERLGTACASRSRSAGSVRPWGTAARSTTSYVRVVPSVRVDVDGGARLELARGGRTGRRRGSS